MHDVKQVEVMMKVAAQNVWAWAYADFLANAQRGVLAEYIVARAVGATSSLRVMWDAVDVTSPNGLRIEVKSAAYLQAWQQTQLSKIRFDIAPKRTWEPETGRYSPSPARTAAVYVFALFETKDRALADPLDLAQWSFRVCVGADLERAFGAQRTVALSALEGMGLRRLSFDELQAELRALGG
jgi:hypothetical protein